LTLCLACASLPPPRSGFVRGVALGLFGDEPAVPYAQQLDEIAALGATHVSLVVTGFVSDVHGSEVTSWPGFTPSPDDVAAYVLAARRRGLAALVFPILRLAHRTPAEWRGVLAPRDEHAFFDSYERFILSYARAADRAGAEVLAVGSELGSTEHDIARWRALIARVRAAFPRGRLLYSANWDHYADVPFWDAVDAIGVSAYYELAPKQARELPDVDAMVRAWQPVRTRLAAFARARGKPLFFTEIGYPSRVGAAGSPWDDVRPGVVSQEEQRLCLVAFARAFADEPTLAGAYVWIWFEKGGQGDRSYTPRGKSAELVLRELYRPRAWLPPPR
jgi:hypothetical protein